MDRTPGPTAMPGFRTKARAIDLLGEKQIADTPTAVSELYKNAHDADATQAVISIDSTSQSLVLWDDGHGMSHNDVIDKWLTIGTDAKLGDKDQPVKYTESGLRVTMGEKGIGRLAIAILGRQMLMITKRRGQPWVLVLIHWGIFENGRLFLEDTFVPVYESKDIGNLLPGVERMRADLLGNVTRTDKHVQEAWAAYPELRSQVVDDISQFNIEHREFEECLNRLKEQDHGTLFYVSNLKGPLGSLQNPDVPTQDKLKNLQLVVGSFVNLIELSEDSGPDTDVSKLLDFDPVLYVDGRPYRVGLFEPEDLQRYDYGLEGHVADGYFQGSFLVQGQQPKPIRIPVTQGLNSGSLRDCGPFKLRFYFVEGVPANSLLDGTAWKYIFDKLNRIGGIYVYRDTLRVLPYGDPNFDFLELEKFRSSDLGARLFSMRRVFGYIALHKAQNPHLQDKSSREGLRENHEYSYFLSVLKTLLVTWRELITPLREPRVAQTKAAQEDQKIRDARQKELTAYLRKLKKGIKDHKQLAEKAAKAIEGAMAERIPTAAHVYLEIQKAESRWTYLKLLERLQSLSQIGAEQRGRISAIVAPLLVDERFSEEPDVKSLVSEYREWLHDRQSALQRVLDGHLVASEAYVKSQLEKYLNALADQLNVDTVASFLDELKDLVSETTAAIKVVRTTQVTSLETQLGQAKRQYLQLLDLIQDEVVAKHGQTLELALSRVDGAFAGVWKESDNLKALFGQFTEIGSDANYRVLVEDIQSTVDILNNDLSHATHEADLRIQQAMSEYRVPILDSFDMRGGSSSLTNEWKLVSHLNSKIQEMSTQMEGYRLLASTGIAAEVVNHEFEQQFTMLQNTFSSDNFRRLAESNNELRRVETFFRHLENYYRLLSPLYQRAHVLREDTSIYDLGEHVRQMFADKISLSAIDFRNEIEKDFVVHESHAILLPALINILNNSTYWLLDRRERVVLLHSDRKRNALYLEDSGQGIDADKAEKVFDLFYSTRQDGRGIGLNLVRELLGSRNHKVDVVTDRARKRLAGACLRITFASDAVLKGGQLDEFLNGH